MNLLNPKAFFRINLWLILLLVTGNLVGIIFKFGFGHPRVWGLVRLFDFDTEWNFPTLYSSLALGFAAALLLAIAVASLRRGASWVGWLGLAAVFVFLAIDETYSIHERLTEPMRQVFASSGCFFYAWVIPYSAGLLALLVIYAKFLLRLPRATLRAFVLAGMVFVAGAIGFELLGGKCAQSIGEQHWFYALCYTCEESLEMLGVAMFTYALLGYRQR